MLYMVDCGFADPAREQEWCDWYDGPKLASLLVLPGWRGSQRFKALKPIQAPWLAVHAVPGPEFFTSDTYKNAGGGNFADWGSLITNWSRNLFDGLDEAPEVPADALLAVADVAPGTALLDGVDFTWLTGVGLDDSVPDRAIAIVAAEAAAKASDPVRLYRPVTRLLRGSAR